VPPSLFAVADEATIEVAFCCGRRREPQPFHTIRALPIVTGQTSVQS